MNKRILWGVVILIIVAGGAFYGGDVYGQGHAPAPTAGSFAGRTGAGGTFTRGGGAGGGFTAGQIVSASNGNIVIQSATASSTEIVLIGASTQVLKTVSGSAADLTPGTSVVITGTTNSDGSMTATSIQVRPAGMNFPGGRGAPSTAGSAPATQ